MLTPEFETVLIFQLIYSIAALAQYLPLWINQLDVGVPGYMALGAYCSAILSVKFGTPFIVSLIAGALCAMCAGLLIDSLAARTKAKGFGFAIISIGFFEIVQVAIGNWNYVNGTQGFSGIPLKTTLLEVALVLLGIVVLLMLIQRSSFGRAMDAIRDDETAAESMGISLFSTKMIVFGMGAFLGGLAGGFYAHYAVYLSPSTFSFALLVQIQLPIIVGGLETFWGAVIGTLLIGFLPEIVRPLADYRVLVTAAVTVAVILIKPNGLLSRRTVSGIGHLVAYPITLVGSRAQNGSRGEIAEHSQARLDATAAQRDAASAEGHLGHAED